LKKVLNKISTQLGFTKTEVNVVLFILGVFIVGLSGKYYKYTTKETKTKRFDYSEQDSLFFLLNQKTDLNLLTQKKLEKKVDSKQEVSDFRNKKKTNKKKNNSLIKEKSINLNTVGMVVLTTLPGIGKKTAIKIIELRKKRTRFKTITELIDVKGIGKTKLEKIKKYLFIEEKIL